MAENRSASPLESIFLNLIKGGVFLLALTPLFVASQSFFPYITGKNFFFRAVVAVIAALWAAVAILNKNYRPARSVIFWALTALIIVTCLSTIFAADPYRSFWSNFERMEGLITYLHLFALFLAVGSVCKRDRDFAMLFFVSLGVSVIVSVYGIFEKFKGDTLTEGGRIFSTFGNSIYLAVYLLFHLFLSVWAYFTAKKVWIKWTLGIIFVINFTAFLLAESRGALMGLAAGVFTGLLLAMFLAQTKKAKLIFASFLIAGTLVSLFVVMNQGTLAAEEIPVISRLAAISLREPTAISRLMIWGIAWEGIKERPVLGWGLENFQIPYAEYYNPSLYGNEAWFDRTHSVVIDWFLHAGILGGALYLALFGVVFWTIRRRYRQKVFSREETILALSLVTAYLVQNLFVFDNITSHILFFIFLAYLAMKEPKSASWQEEASKRPQGVNSAKVVVVSAVFLLLGLMLALVINLKPYLLSRQMIRTFNESLEAERFSDAVPKFEELIAKGTFGQREVREQLTNLANTVAVTETRLTNAEKVALFNLVIGELGQETEGRFSPKHHIFLARMRQQFFSLSNTQPEETEKALMRADELAPNYIQNRFSILEYYIARDDKERVLKELQSLRELKPASGSFWRTILLAYIFIGEGDEAIRAVYDISASGAAPDDVPVLAERALERGDKKTAYFLYKISKIYGGFGVKERLRLAELSAERKFYDKAIEYAEEAAEIDESYVDQVRKFIESVNNAEGS